MNKDGKKSRKKNILFLKLEPNDVLSAHWNATRHTQRFEMCDVVYAKPSEKIVKATKIKEEKSNLPIHVVHRNWVFTENMIHDTRNSKYDNTNTCVLPASTLGATYWASWNSKKTQALINVISNATTNKPGFISLNIGQF